MAGPLLVGGPAGVVAQQITSTVDVGAVAVKYADSLQQHVVSLAPSLHIDAPSSRANVSGLYAQDANGNWTTQGAVDVSLFTSTIPGIPWLRGELAPSI